MNDWIDKIREQLENDSVPLQDGGWERFEAIYRARKRRRRIARLSAIAAAAAAVAAVLLIPRSKPSEIVNSSTELIASVPSTVIQMAEDVVEDQLSLFVPSSIEPIRQEITEEEHVDIVQDTIPETVPDKMPDISPDDTKDKGVKEDDPLVAGSWVWTETNTKTRTRVDVLPYLRGSRTRVSIVDIHSWSYELLPQIANAFPVPIVYGIDSDKVQRQGASYFIPENIVSASHAVPVTIGIELFFELNSRLDIASGVEMSYYRSRFTHVRGESKIQNAYYLGIPLRLDWVAWQSGPVSAWVGAGGKVDRLVYCKFGPATVKDNAFNWSATGVAGIQYELFPKVGLFLEPEVSYYFKPSDPVVQTYRTENPLMFSLGAGLRLGF